MSLDLLRGFRAAAKHLSFTRAARELFVTQPAISREVKTLEGQLGQPLFRRVNRSLQLTEAGRELYRAADEALSLLDAATERIGTPTRKLSLTTTTALASLWLVPKLPGFTRLHPGVDVHIVSTNDLVDLDREQLDLALRYFPPWLEPSGELLFDYIQFPVCSPAYLASRREPINSLADLRKHVVLDLDVILYGRTWSDWDAWLNAKRIARFRPAGTLRLSHYDQVIRAAKDGGGIAIGKWPHVMREICDGSLCAPLGEPSTAKVGGFYLQIRPDAVDSKVVRTFVTWLRAEVRRDDKLRLSSESANRKRRSPRGGSAADDADRAAMRDAR